ncbi:OLC1v1006666C1 [Oldenlandia corymbosa var. corymbosa]|uniref:OLC1v1006666C1 n=1 Tax=Oldenlandia corymbosa var. corymbosa TaxID=529605 RepID=A0AAV1DK97_OLDCO|nr:OLC1v1006666C1 [Oldenlandia corymbosa var. corymbosa]
MASNVKNPFALLDAVGDDDSELTLLAADSSKLLRSPAAKSSPSQGTPLSQPQHDGRQRGRGIPGGQQNGLLKIHEGGKSQDERNGYRRHNEQGYQPRVASNGQGHSNGRSEGYNQYDRRDNGSQQQNIGSNGYRKNSIHEQNWADSLKPSRSEQRGSRSYNQYDQRAYGHQQQNIGSNGPNGYRKNSIDQQNNADNVKPRRNSSGTEHNGHVQGERQIVGGRKTGSNEDNQHESKLVDGDSGSSQERVTENKSDQEEWQEVKRGWRKSINEGIQHESISEGIQNGINLVKGDSGSSQEKFTPNRFYGEDSNKTGNQRFDSSLERRNNRGGNRGNWSHKSRSFDRRGNGEVNTPNIETGQSANMERKKRAVEMKEAEPKENQVDSPLKSGAKDQMEESKLMTLRQYEEQLFAKTVALEALKTEERKVTMDKEFESMKLVGRKKEVTGLENSNSEKEKPKKEVKLNKDKKLGKVPVSIEEFKRNMFRGYHDGGRRGVRAENGSAGRAIPAREDRGRRRGVPAENGRAIPATENEARRDVPAENGSKGKENPAPPHPTPHRSPPPPDVMDSSQFPVLKSSVKEVA